MNIVQSLLQGLQQPPEPPHIGEVFVMWAYYIALRESRALCLLMANHTQDVELREMMEHFIADVEEPQMAKVEAFLRDEGVDLPNVTAEKAKANPLEVPAGAKFTDAEIANLVVVKIQGMMVMAHSGILQAMRNDLGAMWYDVHNRLILQSFSLKALMRKRGWVRFPPQYQKGTGTTPG